MSTKLYKTIGIIIVLILGAFMIYAAVVSDNNGANDTNTNNNGASDIKINRDEPNISVDENNTNTDTDTVQPTNTEPEIVVVDGVEGHYSEHGMFIAETTSENNDTWDTSEDAEFNKIKDIAKIYVESNEDITDEIGINTSKYSELEIRILNKYDKDIDYIQEYNKLTGKYADTYFDAQGEEISMDTEVNLLTINGIIYKVIVYGDNNIALVEVSSNMELEKYYEIFGNALYGLDTDTDLRR